MSLGEGQTDIMANHVYFSGYLGADPETRTVGDTTVTEIRIADTENWKGRDGEKQERTTWMRIDFWGKGGEAIAKYRSKGDWIGIFGKITVQDWEDKEGNKRYTTSIRGERIEWGPKTDSSSSSKSGNYGKAEEAPPPAGVQDDIPF